MTKLEILLECIKHSNDVSHVLYTVTGLKDKLDEVYYDVVETFILDCKEAFKFQRSQHMCDVCLRYFRKEPTEVKLGLEKARQTILIELIHEIHNKGLEALPELTGRLEILEKFLIAEREPNALMSIDDSEYGMYLSHIVTNAIAKRFPNDISQ